MAGVFLYADCQIIHCFSSVGKQPKENLDLTAFCYHIYHEDWYVIAFFWGADCKYIIIQKSWLKLGCQLLDYIFNKSYILKNVT